LGIDFSRVPSPCYVCDEERIKENLAILGKVQEEADCEILLALKGFAMFAVFPLLRQTLKGVSATSLHEARLGREEFGREVHLCAPAYRDDEFDELAELCDTIIFNSFSQLKRFRKKVMETSSEIKIGIRVNPEHSEVKTEMYDPCAPCSRLGVTSGAFEGSSLEGVSGLHFHTLCECGADSLERTFPAVERKFGKVLEKMEWVNFGGGHHITRPDYDVEKLISLVKGFREKYGVKVTLEPGEAIALNAGYLVASVLDIVNNRMDIAILDTSASAHMPDVLEMPYRPEIVSAGKPDEFPHKYRLAGSTCLAGDVIGDYSFREPLKAGDRLVFRDMLHYTMVKNTTFNGLNLPSIAVWSEKEGLRVVKKFGYADYRNRLS
jgi:carboxynorspermidine decarboxylase